MKADMPARRNRPLAIFHLIGMLCALAGCTHDRPLNVALQPGVQLPRRAAVLFLADGLDRTRMNALLDAGQLPNIQQRLLATGTAVQNAVAALPTLTYANTTSLLTGQFPGSHGILGNKWFDRDRLELHDYTTIETYRNTDRHFRSPTIYEQLPGQLTVSIQCAVRRGATRVIDNWATSGINWFFSGFDQVDKLIAMRFELIVRLANETGRWPVFVNAYFPGIDETGHRYGADSEQYAESLRNLDTQIGRILDAYERIGLAERTFFVLTSDHGHVPVQPSKRMNVIAWLQERAGLRVCAATPSGSSYEDRYLHLKSFDTVVIDGGNRRATIHLRGPDGWHQRPGHERITETLNPGPGLWNDRRVALVAIREGPNTVFVRSADGMATIRRERTAPNAEPAYRLDVTHGDPLEYLAHPPLREFVEAGNHTSRQWLAATAQSRYPDFVPQIVEMFDSPHAGDAVVFAADSATFDTSTRGGHGSALQRDIIVPMIWCGPGIPTGGQIQSARTVDVAPTLLDLLQADRNGYRGPPTDGVSLAQELRNARSP